MSGEAMDNKFSRKKFIQTALTVGGGLALGWGAAGCGSSNNRVIPGKILGANAQVGHKLRTGQFAAPSIFEEKDIVIVGGGIAGLSAARYLQSQGVTNFVLLDLEEAAGGNSRSGKNAVSNYPWGAHYLPIPGLEHKEIIDFLVEAGCITGFENGLPVYNELYLCHAPEERLFINGIWQNGLIPRLGNSKQDDEEFNRFHQLMEGYKNAVGPNNKPLFALPLDDSDYTPESYQFDGYSFEEFLRAKGFHSKKLHWYVNYCCRDDYGTESSRTSAFAGIHYFAGRRGQAHNAENGDVLTWPEGNAFLAGKLQQNIRNYIQPNALAYKVEKGDDGSYKVYYNKANTNVTVCITTKRIIMATPQFINKRLLANIGRDVDYNAFSYAPWMVANLTLKNAPAERTDSQPLSWDNVLYNSTGLGYINSCHQHLNTLRKQTVLTYYMPLSAKEPAAMRNDAYAKTIDQWQQQIIADLKRAHPAIESEIENLDVWLWGHAMARPTVGFLANKERIKAQQPIDDRIFFAHSDLGLPVFEEAFYQGRRAAEKVLKSLAV